MQAIVIVVLGVVCAVVAVSRAEGKLTNLWPVLVIAAGIALKFTGTPVGLPSEAWVGVGCVLLFASWVGVREGMATWIAAAALGVAGAAFVARTEGTPEPSAFWWVLGAASLVALSARAWQPERVGSAVCVVPWITGAVAAPMALAHTTNSFAWNVQFLLGLAVLQGFLLVAVLAIDRLRPAAYVAVGLGVLSVGWFLKADIDLGLDMFYAVFAALAAAVAAAWMSGGANGKISRVLIVALVWFPIVTLGFAAARGFGIAVSAAVGVVAMLALGGPSLCLSVAPVLAIALFRVLQATYPETTRAFDLGQHYSLLGFLIGFNLMLVVAEWSAPRAAGRRILGSLAVVASLGFALPAASVYLGQKGTTGLFVGLVASAVLALIVRRTSAAAGALALLTCSYTALMLPRWVEWMELSRNERVPKLVLLVGGAAVAVVVAALASREAVSAEEVPA